MKDARRRRSRQWLLGGLACGGALLLYAFPLFRIVSLTTVRERAEQARFNPKTYVERLWSEKLPPALERATDAATLLAEIDRDPVAARARYGRSVGLGSTYTYFIKGRGRIVAVKEDGVAVALDGSDQLRLLIQTGRLFGNAVRDGIGLIDVNDFPNSQEFNRISTQINARIESEILPPFRERAAVGEPVDFAGCAEVVDEAADLHPLRLTPIRVSILEH